ncbi:MAG: indole-3-glycerol phosphate synthase TrpC [Deltaproteobacteria bacterium]|nr:indole-3-glycerol phosphate synthase TrpC [Deltaproteobacteria bacterium]
MILDDIVKSKKEEVARLKIYKDLEGLKERISRDFRPPRDLEAALAYRSGPKYIRIIAEVKKASPSKGVIREAFMPNDIARIYQANGAAAVSIVTEEKYFQGRLDYLTTIKHNLKIPVLRKDFIFDEYQVYESRAACADAILLIAAILGKEALKGLLELTENLGMSALVEVHDEKDLEAALVAGAKIIGVNNRDLKTFETDIGTTRRLVPLVPKDRILVSESGINTLEDILSLRQDGVDAFLIGEALMREEDIGKKLKELRGIA